MPEPLYPDWDAIAALTDPAHRVQAIAVVGSDFIDANPHLFLSTSVRPSVPIPIEDPVNANCLFYQDATLRSPDGELLDVFEFSTVCFFANDQRAEEDAALPKAAFEQFPDILDVGTL